MNLRLLLFLLLLLAIAALFRPLARRPLCPTGLLLILVGYAIGQTASYTGIDTGLRWYHLQDLILEILLPVLLFKAALEADAAQLREHAVTITLLAFPLMLFMLAVTACVLYFGINHPSGFPWLAAWMGAALLAATDTGLITAWLARSGRDDIAAILAGEGFISDTTAIVLFSLLVGMATMPRGDGLFLSSAPMAFLQSLAVGLITGAFMALLQRWLLGVIRGSRLLVVISGLFVLYITYVLTRRLLHGSGVIAVVVLGVTVKTIRSVQGRKNLQMLNHFWELPASLTEYFLYLLAGVTVTLSMFTDRWLAMLLGIIAVLAGRMIAVTGLLPTTQKWSGTKPLDRSGCLKLGWGGIRGVVTLVLALSLPLTIDYWYTLQSIAYGVVLFSLFIQGGSLIGWSVLRSHQGEGS